MRLYMSVNVAEITNVLVVIATVVFVTPTVPGTPFAAAVAVLAEDVAAFPALMTSGW